MIAALLALLLIAAVPPPPDLPDSDIPDVAATRNEPLETDAPDEGDSGDEESDAESPVLRLPPVDECASDPEFAAFRDELQRAVMSRDTGSLLALVDEDVEVDFGGGSGREDFVRAWRLDMPGESRLWGELAEALSLGCMRDGDQEYWSPSLYLQVDELEDDSFDVVALQGGELHAEPNPASPLVGRLDWELATAESDDGTADWLQVRLADGRSGFMRRRDLRRVTDYRAGFERVDDRWVLSWFVAGD